MLFRSVGGDAVPRNNLGFALADYARVCEVAFVASSPSSGALLGRTRHSRRRTVRDCPRPAARSRGHRAQLRTWEREEEGGEGKDTKSMMGMSLISMLMHV